MGFAGNNDPNFIIPTEIAVNEKAAGKLASKRGIEDLDFYIGDEARQYSKTYSVYSPVRQGQVGTLVNCPRRELPSCFPLQKPVVI